LSALLCFYALLSFVDVLLFRGLYVVVQPTLVALYLVDQELLL